MEQKTEIKPASSPVSLKWEVVRSAINEALLREQINLRANMVEDGKFTGFLPYRLYHEANESLADLQEQLATLRSLVKDGCEDETAIQKLVAPILGEKTTYGDSYGVPTSVDLVEALLEQLATAEKKIADLEKKEAQPDLNRSQTDGAFFVFDVESVGLHGEGFAVGGGVYLPNGAALEEFRFACPIDECDGADSDRQWVKENIPPIEETHRTPKAVRDAFWQQWIKAKTNGALAASDCGWPVEANFLRACVADNPEQRRFEGPYPLHDLGSVLLAAGMDPLANYERKPSELPKHDPLCDARQSARMLTTVLSRDDVDGAPLQKELTSAATEQTL